MFCSPSPYLHAPQYYRPLNVRVALVGLEIWNDQDKILIDKSPGDTLNRFLEWRNRELLPRLRHDNAQLIMWVLRNICFGMHKLHY